MATLKTGFIVTFVFEVPNGSKYHKIVFCDPDYITAMLEHPFVTFLNFYETPYIKDFEEQNNIKYVNFKNLPVDENFDFNTFFESI